MKQLYMLPITLLWVYALDPIKAKRSQIQRKRRSSINEVKRRRLIIGGTEARSGDYPYFVHYSLPGCGGSLIAPDIVLTAGHCRLDHPSDYGTLYIGRHNPGQDGAQGFLVVSHIVHPGFDDQVCCGKADDTWFNGVHNDFMLLELSAASNTPPVKLNRSELRPRRGDELHVIGFGDTAPGFDYKQPDRLHEVTVNYMSNQECLAKSVYTQALLTPMSMCAGDRREDACSGDSGGPLIAKGVTDADDVLMGVVSWGWDCAVQPGVYARVSNGYNWIRDEVCRMSNNPPASFRCPAPPTTRPTAASTHMPSINPVTKLPTIAPTKRPTPIPTTRPSSFPSVGSVVPTTQASTSPSLVPSAEPSSLPTATSELSLLPSHVASQQHWTESPTRENTHDHNGEEEFDFLLEASEGTSQYQPFKSLQRRALPDGKSCPSASMSLVVCCSSLSSNNDDGTFGTPCYPSLHGGAFEGGMPCEAVSWAENHDPGSFDPEICNLLLSLTNDNTTAGSTSVNGNITGNEGEEGNEVEALILSVWGDRRYLPDGMSCFDLTDRTQCCEFLDNRLEKEGDMYHGQPCVAVRHDSKFPNGGGGVCETANFVAEHFPESAMDCADAALQHREQEYGLYLLSTLTQQEMALDDYLKELQTQIHLSRQSPVASKWNRTLLALDQPCQAILDPLVCCAARQTEQECMTSSTNRGNNKKVAKEPSWMLGGLDGKPSRARSRSRRRTSLCLPRPRKLDSPGTRIDAGAIVEVEISSHTTASSIPFSSLGDEQESDGSMVPTSGNANNNSSSKHNGGHDDEDDHDDDTALAGDPEHHDDDDPCEALVQDELLRRSPVKECTSLKQTRSCCSAMELPTTQPCVFVVGQGCTSMDWLISNLAHRNSTVIVDCASVSGE